MPGNNDKQQNTLWVHSASQNDYPFQETRNTSHIVGLRHETLQTLLDKCKNIHRS